MTITDPAGTTAQTRAKYPWWRYALAVLAGLTAFLLLGRLWWELDPTEPYHLKAELRKGVLTAFFTVCILAWWRRRSPSHRA